MSLLDGGTDTVLVWPEVASIDGDGNPVRVPALVPVAILGRVQPVSADESSVTGDAVHTVYKFICRDFPAGAFARVEWDGRKWDIDGEPMRYGGSPTTAHVRVLLRARRPEAL